MKFLVDNSIISSLAKIGKLEFLRDLGTICTTPGVLHEALMSHIENIETAVERAAGDWLKIEGPIDKIEAHKYKNRHPILSYVDSELVLTAKKYGYCLLTDDRALERYAEKECGVSVFDMQSTLSEIKRRRGLSKDDMKEIISDLEKKDSYGFPEDVKKVLLED